MRVIPKEEIINAVEALCLKVNVDLAPDTLSQIQAYREREKKPRAKRVLSLLLENAAIASEKRRALCQDTGMAVFWVEVGQEVWIQGGLLQELIDEGVRRAYNKGYFRMSVADPLTRMNTQDNTPAIVYTEMVLGDKLKICFAPKGFGSENMSGLRMLKPADGVEGILSFLEELLLSGGANACPPLVIGMGIGGTMEKAALLSKKALFRETGAPSPHSHIQAMEEMLLNRANALNIGPQGYGGDATCLAVHIETHPTHIAGLPVAINLNCHAARHGQITL